MDEMIGREKVPEDVLTAALRGELPGSGAGAAALLRQLPVVGHMANCFGPAYHSVAPETILKEHLLGEPEVYSFPLFRADSEEMAAALPDGGRIYEVFFQLKRIAEDGKAYCTYMHLCVCMHDPVNRAQQFALATFQPYLGACDNLLKAARASDPDLPKQYLCDELESTTSVWIFPAPAFPDARNTTHAYEMREVDRDDRELILDVEDEAEADKMRKAWMYWNVRLGDPDGTDEPSLRMLDALLWAGADRQEREKILRDEFGLKVLLVP